MMDSGILASLEETLSTLEGIKRRIQHYHSIRGGCIHEAIQITIDDGRSFFVKFGREISDEVFQREAESLITISQTGQIRVPEVVAIGTLPRPFLILEWIESGIAPASFQSQFGKKLAKLHLHSKNKEFGFAHDNFIGSTQQPNAWNVSWVEFWRENRLRHQLRLCLQNGFKNPELERRIRDLDERLENLLEPSLEEACLLHGDLWGGNYLVDPQGEPVLIDPASYYGHREADLAMTYLFGGFSDDFYQAYNQTFPLKDNSETRMDVYKLYHLMNHLNLFGGSYLNPCLEILRRLT